MIKNCQKSILLNKPFALSALVVTLFGTTLLGGMTGCTKTENTHPAAQNNAQQTPAQAQGQPQQAQNAPGQPANLNSMMTAPGTTGDLKIEDPLVGTGAEAKPGNKVSVHYTGWLTDGKEFDSSKKAGRPFQFQLGAGQVIQGWERGVAGMKVGGKRKLTVPPQMGYGERGAGGVIPPNATLVFEIELLNVES
jgi:FKBP-type peptidyl-prolyl cis-trans isomerase